MLGLVICMLLQSGAKTKYISNSIEQSTSKTRRLVLLLVNIIDYNEGVYMVLPTSLSQTVVVICISCRWYRLESHRTHSGSVENKTMNEKKR
jgi:hypothetical protein